MQRAFSQTSNQGYARHRGVRGCPLSSHWWECMHSTVGKLRGDLVALGMLRLSKELSYGLTAYCAGSDRYRANCSDRADVEDDMDSIFTGLKKLLAYLLSFLLVVATIPDGSAWSQTAQPQIPSGGSSSPDKTASSYTGQGAPLTTEEIDSLVSPIALYPDALVAQILSAATFPDQIAVANYWVRAEQKPDWQCADAGGR